MWMKPGFFLGLVMIILLFPAVRLHAQDDEFVLNFGHPSIGNYYVSAIYADDKVFLPLNELFNLFLINISPESNAHHVHGQWMKPGSEWSVNVVSLIATVEKSDYVLSVDELRLGAMDLYLLPEVYERVFGLRFEVNMRALGLKVEFDGNLPVVEKKKREALRKQLALKNVNTKDFPLLFPRQAKFLGLGFIDYYVEANLIGMSTYASFYNLHMGLELLGGDFRGSLSGALMPEVSSPIFSNVVWRKAFIENKFFTNIYAGQISTTATESEALIGVAFNNEPIRPRQLFHTFQLDGTTTPDSEVELYVNEQLVDFVRANELGYYRFSFPLTYGTMRMSTRIYTPSGQVIYKDTRMQIPFNFLPKGVVVYNIQAGIPDDGTSLNFTNQYKAHGDVGVGITPSLTARLGVDYAQNLTNPTYYGSMSTRLWKNLLLNVDVAPQKYLKATANYIMYMGNSIDLAYSTYDTQHYESPGLVKQEAKVGMFFPIIIGEWKSGFRFSATNRLTSKSHSNQFQADYSTGIKKLNFRVNYMEQMFLVNNSWYSSSRTSSLALTYTISRSPGVPVFAQGMFVRGQFSYDWMYNEPQSVALQFSRSYRSAARINVSLDYDLRFDKVKAQVGVTLDFNVLRSSTQFDYDGNQLGIKQGFNGSAGLDVNSRNLRFSNRDNVGRGAASVMMFLDTNENRKFDEGEQIIPAKALRMQQLTSSELGKDGILRLTQLQPYWSYQAEVVISMLPDPTLAPLFTKFSFVVDPNQFKRIEIPMYRAGIMEGNVILERNGEEIPLSGVRVILKSKDRDQEEIMKTFSDGGFYSLNLIPGKYTLEIDQVQLDFLGAVCDPPVTEFEVKASMDGDYIGGVIIRVIENPKE